MGTHGSVSCFIRRGRERPEFTCSVFLGTLQVAEEPQALYQVGVIMEPEGVV